MINIDNLTNLTSNNDTYTFELTTKIDNFLQDSSIIISEFAKTIGSLPVYKGGIK